MIVSTWHGYNVLQDKWNGTHSIDTVVTYHMVPKLRYSDMITKALLTEKRILSVASFRIFLINSYNSYIHEFTNSL